MARAVAKGVDPLLGARLLFIAPCAAKGCVEVVVLQGIEQCLRLEQPAASLGIERNRVRPCCNRRFIPPYQQFGANRASHLIAKGNHLVKLEPGVDMQQRKRNRPWVEGFLRKAQHHRGILADGVQHHRPLKFGDHFAKNVEALCLEQTQMAHAA